MAVAMRLRTGSYSASQLLRWFWTTKTFRVDSTPTSRDQSLAVFLSLGMFAQIVCGVWLLVDWARFGTTGAWAFGAALVLSYPIVWTVLLAVLVSLGWLVYAVANPKRAGKSLVCSVLELQVRQLRRRHHFKVVAVAGSVGKTSTKLAIAELLEKTGLRVRYQTGNYNDRLTVPLVFFGLAEPNIFNPFAWFKVLGISQSEIALPYPYDVVVVELGTDGPGQLRDFAYLKPDLTVVTAVAAEHMEYFSTLDAVAAEELTVFDYSRAVLVNADDIAGTYLAGRAFTEYSLVSDQAKYFARSKAKGLDGQHIVISLGTKLIDTEVRYLGVQGAKITLAAAAAADMLDVSETDIAEGLSELYPPAGRMQILPGIKNATVIDDTYNASPVAVKAALDVLYDARATQRVAILGSMNQLGDYARQAHHEVGNYCNPKKLDVVVTIGHDAKTWLAPAARDRGCTVHTFVSAPEAGAYVADKLMEGAVVLAKGSQDGVFAEEAVKPLLANPTDAAKLVRQSPVWLAKKAKRFSN